MKRGAFIVLEGIDRCGKTSQAQLVLNELTQNAAANGLSEPAKCELFRFPDRTTPTGTKPTLGFFQIKQMSFFVQVAKEEEFSSFSPLI
jgi:hypothetical protein